MWWFTPFLNLANILALRGSRSILMKMGETSQTVHHVLTNNSGKSESFSKISCRQVSGNSADQGEYFWNSSEPCGGFYVSKTRGKLADRTFRATSERPQASNSRRNLDILAQNLGNYVGAHPLFKLC